MAFVDHKYASISDGFSCYATVDDGDDLVPDIRGSLTPSQMVDAKFFALVGGEASGPREDARTSLHNRRMHKELEA